MSGAFSNSLAPSYSNTIRGHHEPRDFRARDAGRVGDWGMARLPLTSSFLLPLPMELPGLAQAGCSILFAGHSLGGLHPHFVAVRGEDLADPVHLSW